MQKCAGIHELKRRAGLCEVAAHDPATKAQRMNEEEREGQGPQDNAACAHLSSSRTRRPSYSPRFSSSANVRTTASDITVSDRRMSADRSCKHAHARTSVSMHLSCTPQHHRCSSALGQSAGSQRGGGSSACQHSHPRVPCVASSTRCDYSEQQRCATPTGSQSEPRTPSVPSSPAPQESQRTQRATGTTARHCRETAAGTCSTSNAKSVCNAVKGTGRRQNTHLNSCSPDRVGSMLIMAIARGASNAQQRPCEVRNGHRDAS